MKTRWLSLACCRRPQPFVFLDRNTLETQGAKKMNEPLRYICQKRIHCNFNLLEKLQKKWIFAIEENRRLFSCGNQRIEVVIYAIQENGFSALARLSIICGLFLNRIFVFDYVFFHVCGVWTRQHHSNDDHNKRNEIDLTIFLFLFWKIKLYE